MIPGGIGFIVIAASVGAAVGALYLLQYLYTQRARAGAGWFMGNIASVALFCLSYGVALLIFAPTVRVALESVAFVSVCFMGPFFLAFGLDYTGRSDLIRTPLFGAVAVVPLATVGLAATNASHGLLWTGFQFEPVFGLATVTYTIQPWGRFALLFSIVTAAIGSLLLIGAVVSYGALYRREAIAVTLSTVPPSVGVFLWMFEIGPIPELHLTAPLMVIHVALDAYAFVGTHMFESNPATQRSAERTSIDSLSDPVLILDTEAQIVRMNDRAETVFFDTFTASLPIRLETALGVSLETLREAGEITVGTDRGGTFALSYTPLTDPLGETVGSMLVLYDVTEQRQRGQQLSVLNRVLRHNLRNETMVITGYADLLKGDTDDPLHSTYADTIAAASDRLNSIAKKVRHFEDIQSRPVEPDDHLVTDLVTEISHTCTETHEKATVETTVTPTALRVRTDRVLLSTLLENLVENAIVHGDGDATVSLTASEATGNQGGVRFAIRDTNERIPDNEIKTIRAGEETALQHGQGIGLWIVYWCVRKLHGEIDFEYDDGNVLTVTIPAMDA